jgi:hypothetical protein
MCYLIDIELDCNLNDISLTMKSLIKYKKKVQKQCKRHNFLAQTVFPGIRDKEFFKVYDNLQDDQS